MPRFPQDFHRISTGFPQVDKCQKRLKFYAVVEIIILAAILGLNIYLLVRVNNVKTNNIPDKKNPGSADTDIELVKRSLEQRIKMLELEWSDAYDKIRRALGRLSKDKQIEEKTPEPIDKPLSRSDLLRRRAR